MQLSRQTLTRNTIWAVFAVVSLSAFDNAVVHIFWLLSAVWAMVYLAMGRLRPQFDGAIRVFVMAGLLYFLVNALYFGLHFGTYFPQPNGEIGQLLKLVVFVLPVFVAARLAVVPREALLRTVWRASAIWGLVTLPLAAYQSLIIGARADAGIGNAIPFALMGAIFSVLSLLCLLEDNRRWRYLGTAGFAAGLLCVMFSQTKSMMLVPLIGPVIFAASFFRGRQRLELLLVMLLLTMVVAGLGFSISGSVNRFQDVVAVASGDPAAQLGQSYSERFNMWSAALHGIGEAPMSGHGFQNRRHFIGLLGYNYNHWHNGFLIAAFDNGIPGLLIMSFLLVSPLLIALRAVRDSLYGPRLFFAFALVFAYAFGGLFNQIYGHGVYDALFVWLGTIIAVSATPEVTENVDRPT
ncbi:MAG: O-antigen ligase family protein [Rhizobium sp.]|nr:O-antigen ligase family protein [Rhizobium sp.]